MQKLIGGLRFIFIPKKEYKTTFRENYFDKVCCRVSSKCHSCIVSLQLLLQHSMTFKHKIYLGISLGEFPKNGFSYHNKIEETLTMFENVGMNLYDFTLQINKLQLNSTKKVMFTELNTHETPPSIRLYRCSAV
ncbi:CLUMA_CG000367, isoform A [Clunio marinus]|uniref:CLUMA_CG000367, isoform A n=1 Tax=Clunio marinus TaxID=568069 RepID=A0A1J1HE79_9DIPT|nr:CLUMA_CG000367, isoform A [Clunio marinus]